MFSVRRYKSHEFASLAHGICEPRSDALYSCVTHNYREIHLVLIVLHKLTSITLKPVKETRIHLFQLGHAFIHCGSRRCLSRG